MLASISNQHLGGLRRVWERGLERGSKIALQREEQWDGGRWEGLQFVWTKRTVVAPRVGPGVSRPLCCFSRPDWWRYGAQRQWRQWESGSREKDGGEWSYRGNSSCWLCTLSNSGPVCRPRPEALHYQSACVCVYVNMFVPSHGLRGGGMRDDPVCMSSKYVHRSISL